MFFVLFKKCNYGTCEMKDIGRDCPSACLRVGLHGDTDSFSMRCFGEPDSFGEEQSEV